MKGAFGNLVEDFFSTIVFLALYYATGDVLLATCVAIAGAAAQLLYARVKGRALNAMAYASMALVIVLGCATLLTRDPRFVLAKPAIGHFTIGFIMLRRGWMLRYMPAIVTDNARDLVVISGYLWAALMLVMGAGIVIMAMTGDIALWAFYFAMSLGAKVAAFVIQYVALRVMITRRIRAARCAVVP